MHHTGSTTIFLAGKDHGEVWTGTSDPKVRRRLQNRINQRLSRQRKAAQKEIEAATAAGVSPGSSKQILAAIRPKPLDGHTDVQASSQEENHPEKNGSRQATESLGAITIVKSIDPLTAMQPELRDLSAKRIFHYTLVILLPTLGIKTLSGESLPIALHRSAISDINVFFAVLVGGAGQRLSLTQSEQDLQAFYKVQIRLAALVRKNLEQGTISDGVLFAILALSIKRNDYTASLPPAGRYARGFNSPVKEVGGLNWLGGIDLAADHIGMLTTLVRHRLSTSRPISPGLREYMQMADLLRASLTLTPPELELSDSYLAVLNNEAHTIRLPVQEIAAFEVDPPLRDILLDIKLTCRLINKFNGSIPFDSQTSKFVQYRDLIQYRLLCLPVGKDELCRLAAMIFSYGVIFPISDPRPIRKLTKELYFTILNSDLTAHESREFMLWVAIIGGIAASGAELYNVFVTLVTQYATALRLHDWSAVLQVLEHYLWLDVSCGNSGRDLWMAATKLMNPGRRDLECGLLLVL